MASQPNLTKKKKYSGRMERHAGDGVMYKGGQISAKRVERRIAKKGGTEKSKKGGVCLQPSNISTN